MARDLRLFVTVGSGSVVLSCERAVGCKRRYLVVHVWVCFLFHYLRGASMGVVFFADVGCSSIHPVVFLAQGPFI